METMERQTIEAKIISTIRQLSEEELIEWIDFMEWLKENNPTTEEATAEMERRLKEFYAVEV